MTNNYVKIGNGPIKVIALHGWFGSSSGWGPFTQVLDEKRFTYVFMDYRGYGGSKAIQGEYTLHEIACDTLELADKLGWQQFDLIGHSMGAKAVQQVLLNSPVRVGKIVALTPVPASEVPLDEESWKLFTSAAQSPQARKAILDFSTGNRLSEAWLERMLDQSLMQSTEEAFAAYFLAWAKGDFSSLIKGNPVPMLVIVGEHDPTLTVDTMSNTYMNWYPHAKLEVMTNAGHYPMDETPIALATSIERFFAD